MIDWRNLDRQLAPAAAEDQELAAALRREAERRRLLVSIATLAIAVALTMLPALLSAQGVTGAEGPAAGKQAVVEHNAGDIELAAPGSGPSTTGPTARLAGAGVSPARSARLVPFVGT